MDPQEQRVRLAMPTGRLSEAIVTLLADAGLSIRCNGKDYRPGVSDGRFDVKLLKAANIPKLVEYGAHDIGFCGLDWVSETGATVETLLDTKILPVSVVVAGPEERDPFSVPMERPLIVASEYEALTKKYMEMRGVEFRYVRTYGATEVFPPEDADLIVDNVATGRTLADNGLVIVDTILASSTIFVGNTASLQDSYKRGVIDELRLLIKSVLDARSRVLIDMNVSSDDLERVIAMLPAMRSPTVQMLHGKGGYAVRAAVPRDGVSRLLPALQAAGATDILQSAIQRVLI